VIEIKQFSPYLTQEIAIYTAVMRTVNINPFFLVDQGLGVRQKNHGVAF
jgi:hypothetical protein